MEYNKLNIFYLALTEKEYFRPLLYFLPNGFLLEARLPAGVQEMNPHSSVNLLIQTGIQANWNTHLHKQTLGITKNTYLGY